MGNRIGVELTGVRELVNTLHALPVELDKSKVIYRALHDGARIVKAEAKSLAPVLQDAREQRRRPGELRSGITQMASRTEDNAVVIRVRNRGYIFGAGKGKESVKAGNPNYWWLVEFGTSKMAAQPFLRPAFESKKFEAAQEVMKSLRRGIDYVVTQMTVFRKAA